MGSFYTNVTLFKVEQRNVADFLAQQKRKAFVSPTAGNFTVVYDQETEDQDTEVLKELAEDLTRQFGCTGLASLVHDSDVYMYWLYENGELIDTYNSLPDYFDSDSDDATPEGGDVKKLCKAFGRPEAESELTRIFSLVAQSNLDDPGEEYLLGEDIHDSLVRALAMPPFAAFTGYYSIENGELPEGLAEASLIKL